MNIIGRPLLANAAAALALFSVIGPADADVLFQFTEAGGTVVMTSSGTLDTTNLVPSALPDGWGGTGIENNGPGDIDIMGGNEVGGDITAQFGFNAGTDASAITNPGGPFSFSDFSVVTIVGTTAFTTYSGFLGGLRQPGIGVDAADIVAGLWTPDQVWTWSPGDTLASLGLNPGTYSVSDSVTGETITIQVGPGGTQVPEPGTITLLGVGLAAVVALRRRKK